jgi:hypothetical protein
MTPFLEREVERRCVLHRSDSEEGNMLSNFLGKTSTSVQQKLRIHFICRLFLSLKITHLYETDTEELKLQSSFW